MDIDTAHDGRDFCFEASAQSLMSYIQQRSVPIPNLLVNSGRGFWAIWLLADAKNASQPIKAWPEKRAQAERLNRAIAGTFEHLGADCQAVDLARVMRCPDSTNTLANREVIFHFVSDRKFTLPELAASFGIKAQKTSLRLATEPKNPRRVAAGRLRWARPLQGFRNLWQMRRVFTKGTRNNAVWCYAVLLRKTRTPEQQIVTQCLELAESCFPALSRAEVMKAVHSSANIEYRISNATFAKKMRITREEMTALPDWFRPTKPKQNKRERQRQQIKRRRACLILLRDSVATLPPLRVLAQIMESIHGIKVTHVTIGKDLNELRVKERTRKDSKRNGELIGLVC